MALLHLPEKVTNRMPRWEGWPKKLMPGVMPRIRRRGPGTQEGMGFHNAKALDTRFYRSESRISFGTSSMTIAFAKPLDWKGSVVAVLMSTA